ncbi:MAG: extracellular solute-binding protein, partial [Acidimicrobiales bacterium]|nr:extracellular solute-binding protein [Acidimicrobiales bacterium]
DLPDVFNLSIPITRLAREGLLTDLSDLEGVQALSPAHSGAFAYDGGVYGYSPTTWVGGIFYNKDLFEDNGIALPTTVDEYLAVIEEFNALGLQGLALEGGSLFDEAMFHYNATIHQSDPGAQSAIYTGETTFAETVQPSIEWVQEELIDSGIYREEFLGYGYEDRLQCFAVDMTCAMFKDGSWGYAGLAEYEDLNLGWMEMPNGGSLGAVAPGWSMSSTPDNEAAALAWFEFLSSDEGLALYQAIGDSFMGVELDYEVPEVMVPARAAVEAGNFNLATIFWGNEAALTFGILFPGMQELAAGSTTPAELAALLDETNADLVPNN